MRYFPGLSRLFFYIFVFLLPWQTKLILKPAASNFIEISLYLSQICLILALALAALSRPEEAKLAWRSPLAWVLSAWFFLIIASTF